MRPQISGGLRPDPRPDLPVEMVLHSDVELPLRRHHGVIDEKHDDQLLVASKPPVDRRRNLVPPDDVWPLGQLIRRHRFGQHGQLISNDHAARRQLVRPEVRDAERLTQHRSLGTRSRRGWIHALAHHHENIVLAGRHRKSPADPRGRPWRQLDRENRIDRIRWIRRAPTAALCPATCGRTRREPPTVASPAHTPAPIACVSSDASTVSVNGTNVPRCALTKSFCHRTRKSDCPDFPAIAASASARIASPSSRCVCSTCRSSASVIALSDTGATGCQYRHMDGRERWRDYEYQYSRRPPHRACRLLQPCEHSALTNLLDHRRVVPPSQRRDVD